MSTPIKFKKDDKMEDLIFREKLINEIRWGTYILCLTLFALFAPLVIGLILCIFFMVMVVKDAKDSRNKIKEYFDENYSVKVEKIKK